MSFLDNLKNIFDVDIEIDNRNINIVKDPTKDTKSEISMDGDRVDLNLGALDEEETSEANEAIRKGFRKGEVDKIFEKSSKKEISKIEENKDKDRVQETLSFFEGSISEKHLNALEAGLHLREKFENDEDVSKAKRDISETFGEVGKNIANMCTGRYFDEDGYIRQLHENTENPEDNFQEKFEEVIEIVPFAVFVSKFDSKQEVLREVKRKLRKHKKYGIDFLDVRGIGRGNIEKVNWCIEKLEEELENIDYDEDWIDGRLKIRIDLETIDVEFLE